MWKATYSFAIYSADFKIPKADFSAISFEKIAGNGTLHLFGIIPLEDDIPVDFNEEPGVVIDQDFVVQRTTEGSEMDKTLVIITKYSK